MREIKPFVYENLTAKQRVIAAMNAEARGDREELQRLVRTCPKKSYQMNDAEFSDTMQNLFATSMAVELDLARAAVRYLFLCWLDKDPPPHLLNGMAVIQAAWDEEVSEMGLDPQTMAKAGCPRDWIIDQLIDQAEPPDPEEVKLLRHQITEAQAGRFEV